MDCVQLLGRLDQVGCLRCAYFKRHKLSPITCSVAS